MNVVYVPARAHGRLVVRDALYDGRRSRLLLAFHGYAQRAESMHEMLEGVPGIDGWTIASIQALHPFYGRNDQVVASWMTREERELTIAENVEYVDDATVALQRERRADVIVCVGFSQGASMAWRAGVLGRRRADGVVALAGDIPPELKDAPAENFPIGLVAGRHARRMVHGGEDGRRPEAARRERRAARQPALRRRARMHRRVQARARKIPRRARRLIGV